MKGRMRMLIATDGSDFSKFAVDKACEFMKAGETEVVVLSAYENPVPVAVDPAFVSNVYYQGLLEALVQGADSNVHEAEAEIRTHFSAEEVPVTVKVLNGFADQEIVEKAKEWNADLIVVGSHGRGFWGRMLGSVSNGVAHHAPCSVLVAKRP